MTKRHEEYMPENAMVLAAGLGIRMRPLTNTVPKPLLHVAGRAMLDQVLDHLEEAGVALAVVNTHWLPEKIEAHLGKRTSPRIEILRETELLETGGGIVNALAKLGNAPFFVTNADIVWRNGTRPALHRLAQAWESNRMDALLLLVASVRTTGYAGVGDFIMDSNGSLVRRPERQVAPFVFTGVQIINPRLFQDTPAGTFSMNLLYDRAIKSKRLYGIVHDGDWYHVGTPTALEQAEAEILEKEGSRVRMLF